MCLKIAKNVAKIRKGYKFYKKNADDTYEPTLGNPRIKYQRGAWYAALGKYEGIYSMGAVEGRFMHDSESDAYYPTGFHILLDKTSVYRFLYAGPVEDDPYVTPMNKYFKEVHPNDKIVLVEVDYFGVLADGIDYTSIAVANAGTQCVVAGFMAIVKEIPEEDYKQLFRNVKPRIKGH